MSKKKDTAVIKFNSQKVILQAEMNENEFSVLKLALQYYKNGYGLNLLKRIEKAEK